VLLGRPLCFAATVAGSAIFIVGLPLAVTSRSVRPTAEALILKPARATFIRPLGEFGSESEQECASRKQTDNQDDAACKKSIDKKTEADPAKK
jgi:hypothetical protein